MKKALLFAALLACSTLANAGYAQNTKITFIHFMPEGYVIFHVSMAQRGGVPACATVPYRFILDSTTAVGRMQLAGLLTAYAMGKSVNIYGTDSCLGHATETLHMMHTLD